MFFYLRIVNHTLVGDEYNYSFVIGGSAQNGGIAMPVTTIHDVTVSMQGQWTQVNGRIPVHFLEQCFTGIWGIPSFAICNIVIFWVFVYSFITLTIPNKFRYDPFTWLLVLLALLYLYPNPSAVWTSINITINYLWPACGALVILNILKYRPALTPVRIIGMILLGFFTGWSNEAVSYPLAGAIFISYIWRCREFKGAIACVSVPLFIGCFVMLLAPGNWNRVGAAGSFKGLILGYPSIALSIWPIYLIGLLLMIYILINWKKRINLLGGDINIFILYMVSFLFVIVAHTAPHSLFFFVTASLLLLFYTGYPWVKYLNSSIRRIFSVIIFIFISFQQVFAVKAEIEKTRICNNIFEQYASSPDGLVKVERPKGNFYGGDYFVSWLSPMYEKGIEIWEDWNWGIASSTKPLTSVPPELYEDIRDNGILERGEKVAGNAGFLKYSETFIIPENSFPLNLPEENMKAKVTLKPSTSLKRFLPEQSSFTADVVVINTVQGKFGILKAPDRNRGIKSIDWDL